MITFEEKFIIYNTLKNSNLSKDLIDKVITSLNRIDKMEATIEKHAKENNRVLNVLAKEIEFFVEEHLRLATEIKLLAEESKTW